MHPVHYVFLRALELEGRHPHDVGAWHITVRRIEAGEGTPLATDSANIVQIPNNGPLPPSPKLSKEVLKDKIFYYRRARTPAECARYLRRFQYGVPISIPLTRDWGLPVGGNIPMPASDQLLSSTHLVVLDSFTERGTFSFLNTWGPNWGVLRRGYIPFEYVKKYCFESWLPYPRLFIDNESTKISDDYLLSTVSSRDENYQPIQVISIYDQSKTDRLAWAFILKKETGYEIEELYVRPEYRRQGFARIIIDEIISIIPHNAVLRVWVPFADCKKEDPNNYDGLVRIAELLNVKFTKCEEKWAAYHAVNIGNGSRFPIEPDFIPERPRSTLNEVLKKARVAVVAGSLIIDPIQDDGDSFVEQRSNMLEVEPHSYLTENEVEVMSQMNQRRSELIWKKIEGALSPQESREYQELQDAVLESTRHLLPIEHFDMDELKRLRENAERGSNEL